MLFLHQTPRLVDRLPHLGSKSLSDGRCYDHHHDSYCSHLLEHVCPSAGSEALTRSRRGHRNNMFTALSTVSHGPSRYPIVRNLVVPPTELTFAAGELRKDGKNLEEIGTKFLGPNCSGVCFFKWRNAYLHFHGLGKFGNLEANLETFKTALTQAFAVCFPCFPLRPKVRV